MLLGRFNTFIKPGIRKFKISYNSFHTTYQIKQSSVYDDSIHIKAQSENSKEAQEDMIPTDPFLAASGGSYVEMMYQSWQKDPSSVHLSWNLYFSNLNDGRLPAYQPPPNLVRTSYDISSFPKGSLISEIDEISKDETKEVLQLKTQLNVERLAKAYIKYGHTISKLDPLGLKINNKPEELNLKNYGLTEDDLTKSFQLSNDLLPGYYKNNITHLKLNEILSILDKTYGSSIGYEFDYINDKAKVQWLKERIESPTAFNLDNETKLLALKRLTDTDHFERMFATKYTTVKRYGLEGGDSMIPGVMSIFDYAGDSGIKNVIIGMPHRGRLNFFCNVMQQPAENVFAEFTGKVNPPHPLSGDSSYHLSAVAKHTTIKGNEVNLSLSANPSHLEAVNPVTMGTTRARQTKENGKIDVDSTMGLLLHGDAAIAGQGVVYETIGFHSLPSFNTGGTIHMIVNNQIGFTTNPYISRSCSYSSDIAKMIGVPVIHVNGDDIEAVLEASKLAVEWRQKFHQDIFIDLICYRKNGHNEVDQPSYTQPKMYKQISKQKTVLDTFSDKMILQGLISKGEFSMLKKASWDKFEAAYQNSRNLTPVSSKWEVKPNTQIMSPKEVHETILPKVDTGAKLEHLERTSEVFSSYPKDFQPHRNLVKVLQARQKMAEEGKSIDWATAELLAFGSSLMEGRSVRISGQDVERGTFSQRHAVIIDQNDEKRYTPLNHLCNNQGFFSPCNSSLSEFGVLGFEFGYSLENQNDLVLWEAQFGDFSNVAQCMIDQFVASSEQKWLLPSGIVILLPHGFDGNGPEHSSGRLERYLQISDENPNKLPENMEMQHQKCNWSIINCTTPANYFHALRRQVVRPYRKPLISFNGKGILRHPSARSTIDELIKGSPGFQRGYPESTPENLVSSDSIRTHILCSGQIYYRLLKAREQNGIKDVAISRIEELAPFPFDLVQKYCSQYPNAELVWCQEEPINMGAYSHILPRVATSLGSNFKGIRYVGRAPSSAVAVGNKVRHYQEEYKILSEALYGEAKDPKSITNGIPNF